MVKVSVTIEGEPEEIPAALATLAASLSHNGAQAPAGSGGGWSEADFAQFWRTLQTEARRILAELARRPEGYPFGDLFGALGMDGSQIGGRLSSVGHVMRQFPGRQSPLERDYTARVYRMRPEIAEMILRLANDHTP